jgi:hypothetical protein
VPSVGVRESAPFPSRDCGEKDKGMNAELPFYFDINGETKGPYTLHQLCAMWDSGIVTSETLFCQEGMSAWLPLSTIQAELEPDDDESTATQRRPSCEARTPHPVPRHTTKSIVGFCLAAIICIFVTLAIIGLISARNESRAAVAASAWDGSVSQVKEYLKTHAKDPDSLQFIEWSPVERLRDVYAVRCKYRAKNSFGGYAVENKIFALDESGRVLGEKYY